MFEYEEISKRIKILNRKLEDLCAFGFFVEVEFEDLGNFHFAFCKVRNGSWELCKVKLGSFDVLPVSESAMDSQIQILKNSEAIYKAFKKLVDASKKEIMEVLRKTQWMEEGK